VKNCWVTCRYLQHLIITALFFHAANVWSRPDSNQTATLNPVTIAKELELSIYCGDEVEIILEAFGSRPGTSYKISKQPQFTASPLQIKLDAQGRGRVLYRHIKEKGAGTDVFYYAAQNTGATMSARTRVRVHTKTPPAKLVSDKNIYDFGSVPLGGENLKKIRIRNEGGREYIKKLFLRNPWNSSQNGQDIVILPESALEMEISFRPEVEGEFEETIYFDQSGLNAIRLNGKAFLPFDISPKSLNLANRDDSLSERTAEFKITNFCDQQITILFEAPAQLMPIPAIILEEKETKKIMVYANPEVKTGGKYKIISKSGNFIQNIYAMVTPEPAAIEVLPPQEWNLGMKGGERIRHEFHLQNIGGQSTRVQPTYPDWVKLHMQSLNIEANEKISVFVEPIPEEKFGLLRGRVVFEYENKKLVVNVLFDNSMRHVSPILAPAPEPGPPQIDMQVWEKYAIDLIKIEEKNDQISLEWRYKSDQVPVYLVEYLDRLKSSRQFLEEKIRLLDEKTPGLALDKIANERILLLKEHEKAKDSTQIIEVWKSANISEIYHDSIQKKIQVDFSVPKKTGVYTIKITPLQKNGARMPINYKINIPIQTEEPFWNISKVFFGIFIVAVILCGAWYFKKQRAGGVSH
jgi:hypothetical protein